MPEERRSELMAAVSGLEGEQAKVDYLVGRLLEAEAASSRQMEASSSAQQQPSTALVILV